MKKKSVKVQCPYCGELAVPVRRSRAKWVGAIAGAGLGAKIGGSLGIVGAVFGLSVATAGTWIVAVIVAYALYQIASLLFTRSRCAKCNGKIS